MYITNILMNTKDDAHHLPVDDFFESLGSDLDIPLLCDESPDEIMKNALETQDLQDLEFGGSSSSSSPWSFKDDDIEFFSIDEKNYTMKRDLTTEPMSTVFPPSPSPSQTSESLGSIDWQSDGCGGSQPNGDIKFTLETPPISPPQTESPPASPKSANNSKSPPEVKLIPLGALNLKDSLTQKFLMSKNPAKRICIQPKLDKPNEKGTPRKTIVLSPKDFAALTQRVKQNNQAQPLKVQALPMSKHVKVQNQLDLLPVNKPTLSVTPLIPTKPVKLVSPLLSATSQSAVAQKAPTIAVSTATTEIKPVPARRTIVVKKENLTAMRPIAIKANSGQVRSPIVVKNKCADLIELNNRYEVELKALKRQQRMIKNRESACLSRKKKKEHLILLETRVDELVLENTKLQRENEELRRRVSELEARGTSPNFGNKEGMNKKNTALLLAMVFMVSLNIGGLGGLGGFSRPPLGDVDLKSQDSSNVRHGRTLLWAVEDDGEADRSKPLVYNDTQIRNEPMCMTYVNQTESIRLDSELRQLIIADPAQDNRIDWLTSKTDLELKSLNGMHLGTYPVKSKNSRPRNMRVTSLRKSLGIRNRVERKQTGTSLPMNNAVQVFSPIPEKYAELFDALGHREDTFYLVLLNEAFLLPASSQNNTARPRISLILPTNGSNSTPKNHVTIMQIDCEVTNTRQLNISDAIIPEYLRNQRSSQATPPEPNSTVMPERVSSTKKIVKPYFLNESRSNPLNAYAPENENIYNANRTYPGKEDFRRYFMKDTKNNANSENNQKEIKEFSNITKQVKNITYSADRQMYRKKLLRSFKQVNLG
ncbi:cyclic AMP-dependent transcription factor ATF-6 alpha [Copidosoma floridanum]|uniref:cyclic AMP-dependent transcription factor ATF-6 alpha n=1 Tax=Copidosoma floridanum TaxID=29053 RepID=UPI0006C95553|nr:cyclic AMP-dependent transcription factor ATF-6 alpha [Copidosoma floridanum]